MDTVAAVAAATAVAVIVKTKFVHQYSALPFFFLFFFFPIFTKSVIMETAETQVGKDGCELCVLK